MNTKRSTLIDNMGVAPFDLAPIIPATYVGSAEFAPMQVRPYAHIAPSCSLREPWYFVDVLAVAFKAAKFPASALLTRAAFERLSCHADLHQGQEFTVQHLPHNI